MRTSVRRHWSVLKLASRLRPGHDLLTYVANFRQHARRLREVGAVLGDHGLRLGLRYVGPRTSWASSRYPFIHAPAEKRELIAEIGRDDVGLVLDGWLEHLAKQVPARAT